MLPGCREFQERLLASDVAIHSHDDELATHMAACAACARFAGRVHALRSALSELERLSVPSELPGRVVAACHAGHLQERAAKVLSALGRIEVPPELEQKVLGGDERRLHAPFVLEQLVDEELRNPSKALVRRFASRLPRLEAPDDLFQRVNAGLGQAKPGIERRIMLRMSALATFLVLGGGLVAWLGLHEIQAAPMLAFRIEHVQESSLFDPFADELFNGLTGGCSDLPRVAQEPSRRSPDVRDEGLPR